MADKADAPGPVGPTAAIPGTQTAGVKRRAPEEFDLETRDNKPRAKKWKFKGLNRASINAPDAWKDAEAWDAQRREIIDTWDDDEDDRISLPDVDVQEYATAPPGIQFFLSKTTWQLPRPYIAWEKLFMQWLKYVVRSNLNHGKTLSPSYMKELFYYHLLAIQRIPKHQADEIMKDETISQLQEDTLKELISEAELLVDPAALRPMTSEEAQLRLREIRNEPEWTGEWILPTYYRFARELELIPLGDCESLTKFFRFWCAWLVIYNKDSGLDVDVSTGWSQELLRIGHGQPGSDPKPLADKLMSAYVHWLAWCRTLPIETIIMAADAARSYLATLDTEQWAQLLSGAVRPTKRCPPDDYKQRIWPVYGLRPFVISPYETFCVKCWSYQHVKADCPIRCIVCKSDSHEHKECPVKGSIPCALCKLNHTAWDCPGRRGKDRTACEKLYDGLYIIIPDPLKIRKIKSRLISCRSCTSDEHYYWDCPGSKEKGISKKYTQPAYWKYDSWSYMMQFVDPESDFEPNIEERKRLASRAVLPQVVQQEFNVNRPRGPPLGYDKRRPGKQNHTNQAFTDLAPANAVFPIPTFPNPNPWNPYHQTFPLPPRPATYMDAPSPVMPQHHVEYEEADDDDDDDFMPLEPSTRSRTGGFSSLRGNSQGRGNGSGRGGQAGGQRDDRNGIQENAHNGNQQSGNVGASQRGGRGKDRGGHQGQNGSSGGGHGGEAGSQRGGSNGSQGSVHNGNQQVGNGGSQHGGHGSGPNGQNGQSSPGKDDHGYEAGAAGGEDQANSPGRQRHEQALAAQAATRKEKRAAKAAKHQALMKERQAEKEAKAARSRALTQEEQAAKAAKHQALMREQMAAKAAKMQAKAARAVKQQALLEMQRARKQAEEDARKAARAAKHPPLTPEEQAAKEEKVARHLALMREQQEAKRRRKQAMAARDQARRQAKAQEKAEAKKAKEAKAQTGGQAEAQA